MRDCLVLALVLLSACDEDTPETTSETTLPAVSIMEVPIAHRHSDVPAAASVDLVLSTEAILVRDETVLSLHEGDVPENELTGNAITKLAEALQPHRNAPAATLRVQLHVPFRTLAQVLATLSEVGLHTAFFEVRRGGGADAGWLIAKRFRVGEARDEPIAFEGEAQREWDEFANVWDQVYEGCRRADYVNCEPRPETVADGGQLEIRAWSRGSALRLEFDRFGAAAPTAVSTGPAMLPGVPQPTAPEEAAPPDTHATFTWRFRAATAELSAITDAMRPLCGAEPCSMVVSADPDTPSMQLISLLGAAFPNGTPEPALYFELPE